MNGKLPLDYLLDIISENDKEFQKEAILQLMPNLDKERLIQISDYAEHLLTLLSMGGN